MKRMGTAAVLAMILTGAPGRAGPDDAHDVPHVAVTDVVPDYRLPELWYGSKAPKLEIAEFVKGTPVTDFEPGQVYVVEFWATWCGPCIAAFPHVTQLQKAYGDRVTVIGVNIWERFETPEERSEKVNAFVAKHDANMGYTVAIEDGSKMAESWMTAAGQSGIPSSFIVNQDGKIAWIGHPMSLDDPLKAIVGSTWNPADAEAKAAEDHAKSTLLQAAMGDLRRGETDRAYKIMWSLQAHEMAEDAWYLNMMAWTVLTGDGIESRDTELALTMAKRASKLTEDAEPMILDTLALAYYERGKRELAIATEKKAIEILEDKGSDTSAYRKALARFEKGD